MQCVAYLGVGYRFIFELAFPISQRLRLKVQVLNDWNYWNICREMTGGGSHNGFNGMAR
jgi:hypothetical protein